MKLIKFIISPYTSHRINLCINLLHKELISFCHIPLADIPLPPSHKHKAFAKGELLTYQACAKGGNTTSNHFCYIPSLSRLKYH